jgi:hypothetical protein
MGLFIWLASEENIKLEILLFKKKHFSQKYYQVSDLYLLSTQITMVMVKSIENFVIIAQS